MSDVVYLHDYAVKRFLSVMSGKKPDALNFYFLGLQQSLRPLFHFYSKTTENPKNILVGCEFRRDEASPKKWKMLLMYEKEEFRLALLGKKKMTKSAVDEYFSAVEAAPSWLKRLANQLNFIDFTEEFIFIPYVEQEV